MMEQRIALTGARNSFVEALINEFRKSGHKVSSENEALDVFVFCIDPKECGSTEYDALFEAYENTAMRLLREVSVNLPLLELGKKKRLCFITTTNSSINCTNDSNHWERILSASCNMAIKTIFNRLNPLGYTFRVFTVENYNNLGDASYAADYFLQDRSFEEGSYLHSDEKRIVMRDKFEREYPW